MGSPTITSTKQKKEKSWFSPPKTNGRSIIQDSFNIYTKQSVVKVFNIVYELYDYYKVAYLRTGRAELIYNTGDFAIQTKKKASIIPVIFKSPTLSPVAQIIP